MSSTVTAPAITVDGTFSDWTAAERIDNPSNLVAGYALYGTVQAGSYLIAVQAIAATDGVIGDGTTIWLNTDQNTTTGYSPFGNIGADYNVTFVGGNPYLYTGAAAQNLVSSTPLSYALSSDGKSLEIAIPRGLVTPTGGSAPASINIAAEIANNSAVAPPSVVFLPGDYSNPEYTITDPATLVAKTSTHRIAIVYSDTSANLYFNQTAYSDLIMAAENQARMAGVSYDLIDESKLTDITNLVGYDALVFPSMSDVNTAQLPAIMSALTSAVYNYHISIITAGDFLTNDQTGVALPGNPYANMTALLGLKWSSSGAGTTETVTAGDVSNPIMKGYTAGQIIQTYTGEGYASYVGVATPTDVLVNQNVTGVGTFPGVVQTTTGGSNVHFATTDLLGDSNLLSNAIQSVVLGTQPGVVLDTSRQAGIVALRMDMDQSQFPADVSPVDANGVPLPGIYDKMIPILQQWKQLYNFVGSYYINVGNTPTPTAPAEASTTNWAVSLPYYQALEAMGGEIGNHSYTHLINPPTTTATETTATATSAGSTQVTLSALPSINGVTVGMLVTGTGIGANTIVTAVSGNTVTLSYLPGGYGTANDGVLTAIPAGTTLTFGIPTENTNFLQTTGTGPFTYDYEFNQSKTIEQTNLGTTIYGAAVPGASETYATAQNILAYYPSVAATATTNGYTGYVTGGWTGIGSGYPSAIGYMNPTSQGSVYIAPNMTFDFTEIGYEHKTVAQAEADWAAQFNALAANAAGTPVVVLPVHDYGVAAWNTDTSTGTGSPYTTQMFTDFIANAYAKNYEFLTLEQLASRYNAQQKAKINYTTTGNTITATITPDPTAPDVGGMALNVINGGTNVIQNVTNWYAYNKQEVFLPKSGGGFVITLGTAQDDLTHIASLPMRCDLVSCTGNGNNLGFSITGDGQVVVDLKNPTADIVSIQGAPTASLTGDVLTLTFADALLGPIYAPLQHNVAIEESATEFSTAGNDIVIGTVGNDTFTAPGGGNDTIIGNGGIDTIVYSGVSFNYSVIINADGSKTVTDLRAGSPDGTDTLIGVANVLFAVGISSIVASGTGITNGAGDLGVGGTVTLTVTFSEAVTVAGGTPTLTLNDGGVATYSGGSGTGAVTFTYVVAAGQNTPDLVISSFDLPAGVTIRNAAGANADLTLAANYNPTGILQIDTTAPAETASIVAMTSDSGVAGDFITNIGLAGRTVSGIVSSALPADEIVQASFDAGATWTAATVTGTTWSVIDGSSHASSWTIESRVVDLAGNVGVITSRAVTLDTTAAAPGAPDLNATSDSGLLNNDNITDVVTPNFTGIGAEAGATVSLFDTNGTTVLGTAKADGSGNWTITSAALGSGVHSLTANQTDVAGNVSTASAALAVTIDTTAPVAPSRPNLTAGSDNGVSTTDNITSITTPTFNGTAEIGSTVTLLDGTTQIGSAVATTGTWSITATTLANGTHAITAKATDVAGNVSVASLALAVTISPAAAPVAPSAPDLIVASDSGLSNTDNITKVSTPTFTGSGAQAGATVSLFNTNGTSLLGTATADASGNWTITSLALGNGAHTLTAKQTVAGSVSAASAPLAVTIDTIAPVTPSRPDLITASDNGVSSTDNITSITTPTFSGTAEIGSTVTLFDGTTQIGSGVATGGTWTITTSTLAAGAHAINARATDVAGNVSGATGSLAVTIQTAAPAAPVFTALTTAGQLTGTGVAGSTVTVFDQGVSIAGTGTVGGAGNWTFITNASTTATHVFTAVETDATGHVSLSSGSAQLGTAGADSFVGTSGNDVFRGKAGADTFSFLANFAKDIITDFTATGTAHDIISFSGNSNLNSFANVLSHAVQVGTNVVISQDTSNTLTLNNVSKTSFTSADFRFA
jgi:serralysin